MTSSRHDGANDLSITVDIFSGRPNPVWMLRGEAALNLAAWLTEQVGQVTGDDGLTAGLGFRGLIVHFRTQTFDREWRLVGSRVLFEGVWHQLRGPVQRVVLATAPASIRGDLPDWLFDNHD